MTQISGQMTIFDFLQTEDTENLDDMTDEYLMQKMYEATGLKFVYDAGTSEVLGLNYFKCKVKRREYECYFSTYAYDDHKRFISVGVSEQKAIPDKQLTGQTSIFDFIEEGGD